MTGECLNCGNAVEALYCARCGQKTSTHRFSLKHIFSHDFIHGVFHVDKGLFYTIKELFVRPGHSIREYIEGKRVRHLNYFTLLLLILTAGVMLSELTPIEIADIYESVRESKEMAGMFRWMQDHPKVTTLLTIPVYTFFSWLIFRRAKMNAAEHLVLNSYRAAGELLIFLGIGIAMIFIHDYATLRIINLIFSVLSVLYSTYFYYQFFSTFGFRRSRLFLRSFIAAMSLNLLFFVGGLVYLLLIMKK